MTSIVARLADGRAVRIALDHGLIAAVEEIDAEPEYLIVPGLVDLQVNGFVGLDVNGAEVSPESIIELTHRLWQVGVTRYCPTVITAAQDQILNSLRAIASARALNPLVAASVVGVHVEGPYLSAVDGARGAHDLDQVRDPRLAEAEAWIAASGGLIKIVTLAPERPGALEFIAALRARGVIAALGHTAATAEQVREAVAAGARLSTHLGNGAPANLPRHPNQIWAQLASEDLAASFIADGHHLPADTFTAMVRAKGITRSVLVSDSAALAGCAPGNYATPVGGGVTVTEDGRLVLTGTDFLAGSGRSLLDCLNWVQSATPFSLADGVTMAATNPARLLGVQAGLEIGAAADFALLAGEPGRLTAVQTVVAGELAWSLT